MKTVHVVGLVCLCVVFILSLMFGLPIYNVWNNGLQGEAQLKRAEQTKRIMVQQAMAEKESAQLRADAIKIMGQAAKDFPEYREQEYMAAFGEALRDGNISQIIYIPTEANIPILEANRNK